MYIGKKLDAYLPKNTKKEDEPLPEEEDLELKEPESSENMPKPLTRLTDCVYTNYQTSSSQYNAVVGGIPTSCKYSAAHFWALSKTKSGAKLKSIATGSTSVK